MTKPVTQRQLDRAFETIGKWVGAKLKPLEDRIAALEASGVKYRGVWQAAEQYQRGDLISWDGSIFHCNADTRAKPGNGSTTWSLAVKRGADGKDIDTRKRNATMVRRNG